jgi:hypothetical protein
MAALAWYVRRSLLWESFDSFLAAAFVGDADDVGREMGEHGTESLT